MLLRFYLYLAVSFAVIDCRLFSEYANKVAYFQESLLFVLLSFSNIQKMDSCMYAHTYIHAYLTYIIIKK